MKKPSPLPLFPYVFSEEEAIAYKNQLIAWIKQFPEKTWADMAISATSAEDKYRQKKYPAIRIFEASSVIPFLDKNPVRTEALFTSAAILDCLLMQTANYLANTMMAYQNGLLSAEEESSFSVYKILNDQNMWMELLNTVPQMRDLVTIRSHMGMTNIYGRTLDDDKQDLAQSFSIVDHIQNVWVGWNNRFSHRTDGTTLPDPKTEMIWDLSACAFEHPTTWNAEQWIDVSNKYIGVAAIIGMKNPSLLETELLLRHPLVYQAYAFGKTKPRRDDFVQQLKEMYQVSSTANEIAPLDFTGP